MAIFQRFGTKTVQYQIDIVLNKLYMNVNVPGCEISIILKRGDHKSELKAGVGLKDKVAKFNKSLLSVPTKLYWDEKKKEFLSKMAELQINIIHQKKVRCAGKIEFDVASYASKNIKSMMEQRQLQKCPDSGAKLLYEIRVHPFGDYSAYTNKNGNDEDDDNIRNKQKSILNNNRGRDVSPMIDNSGSTSARGQIQDLDQFNARSKSPISKVEPKQVSFINRNPDQYSSNNGGPNSARGYIEESQMKQNLFQQANSSRGDNNNINKYNSTQNTSQFNSSSNGDQNRTQQFESAQNNLSGSQKQNELTNQSQMRDLFKQQKEDNISLRQKNQELVVESDSMKQQVDTLKNENQRLKSKISTLESQSGSSTNLGQNDSIRKAHQQEISVYEEQIKKLIDEIKSLKSQAKDNKSEDLERQLKDLTNELEINKADITIKFEREKSIYEKKLKDLQLTIEESSQKINELQNEIVRKQKDVDYYKGLVNRSNKEETDNEHMLNMQKQIQELQSKLSTTEKENKQKVKDLQEENQKLKKDRELEIIDLRRTKTESDHELAKQSREIEQIKKDSKELQTKYNQAKAALQQYLNKEGNDVSNKSKELQVKFDEVNNKLVKLSVERGNIEMERDNLKRDLKIRDEETSKSKFLVSQLENRFKNTKENLCFMMNVILMTGDRDLIDEVEPYLNEPDESEYIQQQQPQQQQFQPAPQNAFNTTTTNTNTTQNALFTPNPAYNYNNQFTNNLINSDNKSNELYKSNNFSDKNFY